MSFTPNPSQKKAIEARGTNVLVFASAGGGKTTVLIERLMKRILTDRIPLEEIAAMLDRELPNIGEKTPSIISGPIYLGIDRIDYHRVSIMVSALCQQKDVNKVRRILNEELWDLFRKNGFQL